MSTGAPWTAAAPPSWQRTYLGHVVDVRSGATPSKDEPSYWLGEIPWVSPKDMKILRIQDSEDHISETALHHSALRWIPSGSVLMVTRGMILDHTVPVALTMRDLTINQDLKALVPRSGVHADYLAWLLSGLNDALLARVEEAAHGAKALRTEQWKKLPIAVPPIDRQKAIARFLDRRTDRIDALIFKKERLVALLAEKRQALITQAVTKGLDGGVPMKDSGVDWIGEIPANWDLAPLGSRFVVQLGKMLDTTSEGDGERYPYLRNANVRWEGIDVDDVKTMPLTSSERSRFRLHRGDLLVCEGGANANVVGKSAIWEDELPECYYQKALHRVRAQRPEHSVRYLWYVLWCAWSRGVFVAGANPNTVFHLTAVKLRQQRVPFPPPVEQDRILRRLDEEVGVLDRASSRAAESIRLLREYRQALITAAVTGKLDVTRHVDEARERDRVDELEAV